jgi:hypothetical protein
MGQSLTGKNEHEIEDKKERSVTENCEVVRFEVFTAMTMKNAVFWDVTPCGSPTFLSCINVP